ncbi:hypothetical protein QTL95_17235 [Rhizobium sp. S152]|uniref:hypothetical protein n=1 Tax=Rhizobium sp. S152 TaxID=3055038 RepID=UPI0025AA0DE4|nr:hypothetical protein [Rhizobium sp. S152]MDM9627649.1 hypothetical protein [Rhizobium sp. S152]
MKNPEEELERELGRKKLMLRLPALRDQLRQASGDEIDAIFVAYERAVSHRDRISGQKGAPKQWAAYYQEVFEDLEDRIKQQLTARRRQDFT